MTITSEVQDQFFDKSTNKVISLPVRNAYPVAIAPATGSAAVSPVNNTANGSNNGAPWTDDEHARFLQGLELFPSGPWKSIASCVGTRTSRQTMSHAQKYRQKIARRQRGLDAARVSGESNSAGFKDDDLTQHQQHQGVGASSGTDPLCSDLLDSSMMEHSLSEMHLTNEIIDEIIMSLFEDDGEPLVITQEDMDAIMGTK